MKWIAVEVDGHIFRMWPDGGDEVRRELEGGVTLASLLPEIEHTMSIQPDTQIVASGLITGHVQAVPCFVPNAVHVDGTDPRVTLLPPVMQDTPTGLIAHEVARLGGLIAQDKEFDGVACLVGRQTVWAQISAEEIVSFQSAATTRLAQQLCGCGPCVGEGFAEAVSDIMSRPQGLAVKLASCDAAQSLGRIDADQAHAQISGALIGAELAAMRPYWLGQRVALIGDAERIAPYSTALSAQGVMVEVFEGAELALAGLTPNGTAACG